MVKEAKKAADWDSSKEFVAHLRDFFALERNIVILLVALLILGMGEQLWSSFAPKYLEALGAGALIIGVYGTLQKVIDASHWTSGPNCMATSRARQPAGEPLSMSSMVPRIMCM